MKNEKDKLDILYNETNRIMESAQNYYDSKII